MLPVGSRHGNSFLFLFLVCLPFLGARTTNKTIASGVVFLLVVPAPKNGMRNRVQDDAKWGTDEWVCVPGLGVVVQPM